MMPITDERRQSQVSQTSAKNNWGNDSMSDASTTAMTRASSPGNSSLLVSPVAKTKKKSNVVTAGALAEARKSAMADAHVLPGGARGAAQVAAGAARAGLNPTAKKMSQQYNTTPHPSSQLPRVASLPHRQSSPDSDNSLGPSEPDVRRSQRQTSSFASYGSSGRGSSRNSKGPNRNSTPSPQRKKNKKRHSFPFCCCDKRDMGKTVTAKQPYREDDALLPKREQLSRQNSLEQGNRKSLGSLSRGNSVDQNGGLRYSGPQ